MTRSLKLMYGDALLQGQQRGPRHSGARAGHESRKRSSVGERALLGRAYVQAGRYAEAVPHLEASVEADQDGDMHYQLARAYQALGRVEDAQKAMAEYQKRRSAAAPPPSEVTDDPVMTPPE